MDFKDIFAIILIFKDFLRATTSMFGVINVYATKWTDMAHFSNQYFLRLSQALYIFSKLYIKFCKIYLKP